MKKRFYAKLLDINTGRIVWVRGDSWKTVKRQVEMSFHLGLKLLYANFEF